MSNMCQDLRLERDDFDDTLLVEGCEFVGYSASRVIYVSQLIQFQVSLTKAIFFDLLKISRNIEIS